MTEVAAGVVLWFLAAALPWWVRWWAWFTAPTPPQGPNGGPRPTVEAMADVVQGWYEDAEPEDQAAFASKREQALVAFHHSLGRQIRNHFRLWDYPWTPDMQGHFDRSPEHPDQVSQRVIVEVWRRMQVKEGDA